MKKFMIISSIFILTACTPTKDMAPGDNDDYKEDNEIVENIKQEDNTRVEENTNDEIEEHENNSGNTVNEDWIDHGELTDDFNYLLASLPSPNDLPLVTDYIEVNDNIPLFTNDDLEQTEPFHEYAPLDHLDRTGTADALLDVELMPAEERGSISHIYPTGWNQEKYDVVSGGWLYNRSHLIGHQMTGYDGEDNLMTGTRQFNAQAMLPFENFIAQVIEQDEMQVRYRVRPIYHENNLLAHGITMEAISIDDNGETLMFNVFVPNQQDGITLDYATGISRIN